MNRKTEKGKLYRSILKKLGPGIITAALVFGPGSLTICTKLGAGYGAQLLWVILLAVVLMITFTAISARIGLASRHSLIQEIRMRYGRFLSIFIGIGVFLATSSFQAGNAIGAGVAFGELFDTSSRPWLLFFSALAISFLFFRSFYQILEKLMISLVILMLASFLLTVVISKPHPGEILEGLIPTLPSGSEYLAVALLASSFSIVGAFYQSYLVREKKWQLSQLRECLNESRNGIIILGLLSTMVMICASAVLHEKNIEVNTASDLGLALEPLFGKATSVLFLTGFFAASFSSLLGNAAVGGAILADALNMGYRLDHVKVRAMIIVVIGIGASVAFYFGALPLQLIIVAQGITVLIIPAVAVTLFHLGNSTALLGDLRSPPVTRMIGVAGLGVILVMIFYNIKYLFFS